MFRNDLAIVTCSYLPDLERCRTLCASVQRFVDPEIEHVLIVPRRDRKAFETLANERTRIVTVESLLPIFALQVPFQRRWWLTARSLPVRGWIMQQLTKFASVNAVNSEAIIFVDSDIVFVRPFTADRVWRDGDVRMLRVEGPPPRDTHERWHRDSGRLLGLPESNWYGADYIGPLATWRCETVREILEHITKTNKKHWARIFASMLHLSEYMIYGIYVEEILKGKGHYYADSNMCHCNWGYTLDTKEAILDFLQDIKPDDAAVLIQSNLGIDAAEYAAMIESVSEPAITPTRAAS